MFNLHSINNCGLILGGQSSSKRQTVFFFLIYPRDTDHKDPKVIDFNVPLHAQYLHYHGRDIETQFSGQTSISLLSKDQQSIKLDRMLSSFKKHFQLVVFGKLLEWRLEKSHSQKYTCHLDLRQRSHWNTNGRKNSVQNMLNDHKSGSYLEVSKRTNQLQIQFVRDRGDLITCKMEENVPFSGDRRKKNLFAKNLVLQSERCDLRPVVNHDDSSHQETMLNKVNMWTSEFQGYHVLLWSMRRVPASENWSRKIENHPDWHALQQDLRQNQSFHSFSPESKKMIHDLFITLEYRYTLPHVRTFLA